jgi:hypothetical protein
VVVLEDENDNLSLLGEVDGKLDSEPGDETPNPVGCGSDTCHTEPFAFMVAWANKLSHVYIKYVQSMRRNNRSHYSMVYNRILERTEVHVQYIRSTPVTPQFFDITLLPSPPPH